MTKPMYGTDLVVNVVHEFDERPVRVAIVEQRGRVYLDIRRMYRVSGDEELHFGKGVRIPIEAAQDVLLCAEGTVAGYLEHISEGGNGNATEAEDDSELKLVCYM